MRTEDGSIIHRCLNGEPEAFGILVDKYKEGIYAFAHTRLRDFRDAQDVTQEVFIRAYRDLHSLRRWESFAFWLYRIASMRCRLWSRTQSRRVDQDFVDDQGPKALEVSSMNAYRDNQVSESLRDSINSLPETYREVLMLHYFGGMTIKDMAKAIGASPAAIGMRLSRARAQLKEEMIAMMDIAFDGQRLPAGFTFRIVEAVKRIKINPMPRMAGLPWGLSAAVGIIVTVLNLNPHLSIHSDMANPASSLFPAEMKALKTGEIPVDILNTSRMPALASKRGDGDGGKPDPQEAIAMAPQAGGDTWTKRANMPTARLLLATSVVNGKIYAMGGGPNPSAFYSTLEEYDPVTDVWTKKANMLTGRVALSTSTVNGKIYAIGGVQKPQGPAFSIVEEYDPKTDTWTRKSDMPTARAMLTNSVVNGKIYAIGGARGTSGPVFSTVEEYDPATDTWTRKADLPEPRYYLSSSAVNGKIYVIGGGTREWTASPAVYEYDPATDSWTRKTDMPESTAWHSTSVVNGKIYAIGGGDPNPIVEEYDPGTDTWARKADMPTARGGLSTSALNGKIYSIGGFKTPYVGISTVEVYDTGFVPPDESTSVGPRGKLATTWGEIKSD